MSHGTRGSGRSLGGSQERKPSIYWVSGPAKAETSWSLCPSGKFLWKGNLRSVSEGLRSIVVHFFVNWTAPQGAQMFGQTLFCTDVYAKVALGFLLVCFLTGLTLFFLM